MIHVKKAFSVSGGGPMRAPKLIPFLFITLLVCISCFSPYRGDGAVITIAMGETPAAVRAINLESGDIPRLVHTIDLLSAEGQRHTKEGVKVGETATMIVTPGVWTINVYAYFETDGEKNLIASGREENRDLTSGPNTVTIRMEAGDTLGGTGTAADPFLVYNETTLRKVGTETTPGGWTLDASYKLISDITLSSAAWETIGDLASLFTGTFNGSYHTIRGLTINDTNGSNQGMFAVIGTGGTVQNLSLSEVNITGGDSVGGIAGNLVGTIQNCTVSGTVSGTDHIGGIAGYNLSSGSIQNCYVSGTVSGTHHVGGIAGENQHTIEDASFTEGSVSGSGDNVGGIAGGNDTGATIDGASFTGDSVSGSSDNVGGIAGNNLATIQNCYAAGNVKMGIDGTGAANNNYAGGIAGDNAGTIQECYASAAVSAGSTGTPLSSLFCSGGIAGQNTGTIQNCYATGDLSAGASDVSFAISGGIVGRTTGTDSSVKFCYATGNVNVTGNAAPNKWGGGIAGQAVESTTIRNCAALGETITVTGMGYNRLIGYSEGTLGNNYAQEDIRVNGMLYSFTDPNDPSGASISSTQYTNNVTWWTGTALWDFNTIWRMGANGLPVLRNAP